MNKPKILFIDIETSPNISYTWGKWEQDVIEFKKEWYILSFSAKWLHGKQITRGLCDYKGVSDKSLVKEIWGLFDEADVIVAHNGDQFDIKKIQTRFTTYNIKPPAPFKTIDTKKVAKRYFGFNSNSLNDLGKSLGLGKKYKHNGFELWLGCMAGDKKSWSIMKKYNVIDVILLEKIYLHFLPWISSHPNYSSFFGGPVCPKCGSKDIIHKGYTMTLTAQFRRFVCRDCGGWGRYRIPDKKIDGVVSL